MMLLKYFLFSLTFVVFGCGGQEQTHNCVYVKEFKWTITIPKTFTKMTKEELEKNKMKGKEAIKKTTGEEIVDQTVPVLAVKSDQMNLLEANYQVINKEEFDSYIDYRSILNAVLYDTYKNLFPNEDIDTSSTTEVVDGINFYVSKMKLKTSSGASLNVFVYSSLFGDKDLTINIVYSDESKGKLLLDAFRNSKFER